MFFRRFLAIGTLQIRPVGCVACIFTLIAIIEEIVAFKLNFGYSKLFFSVITNSK